MRAPRTRAEALHNIRQALELLGRAKTSLPLSSLHCDYDVLHGDPRVVVPLLLQVRHAYGHDVARVAAPPAAAHRR